MLNLTETNYVKGVALLQVEREQQLLRTQAMLDLSRSGWGLPVIFRSNKAKEKGELDTGENWIFYAWLDCLQLVIRQDNVFIDLFI